MTEAERVFWQRIRGNQLKGCQFYRQKNIGDFIVDFYCPAANLIIELDGGQHHSDIGIDNDKIRDGYLNQLGFMVLRFPDSEVFENMEGVLEKVLEYL